MLLQNLTKTAIWIVTGFFFLYSCSLIVDCQQVCSLLSQKWRQCLGKSGLLMLVRSCWITLQDMHLVLSLYHTAVDELPIPVLNIHFTVVIFLYFLQKIWTLHVPAYFWVLFPAPLLLPVFHFLFSLHLYLSQYMQLQIPSYLPALIPLLRWSWAACLYWWFCSVIVTMFEQWN